MTPDVIVIGAGIVGAACAAELADRGLSVRVIEECAPAGGATAAGMGHLVVLDGSPAELDLTAASLARWNELEDRLPPAVELRRAGTLWIAADDEEMRLARERAPAFEAAGVAVDFLDPTELAAAEPELRPGLVGAMRVPGDAVIYPPAAAAWFLDRPGVTLMSGSVARVGSREVRLADGRTLEAERIVVAAGDRTLALFSGPLPAVEIRRRKGHLAITARHPGFVSHQILELGYLTSAHGTDDTSVAFNVQPRATGQVLIGSSRQFDVEDDAVEPEVLSAMLDRAFAYMPGLRRLSCVRTWTGFRAATSDGRPVIGPHPTLEGVVIAAGHEGLGITTSTATARLVAHHLLGIEACVDPAPYLADRTREPRHG